MITIFRCLVVLSAVLAAVAYWLPYFDASLYSPEVADLRSWDGFTAILSFNRAREIAFFVVGVVLPVLLYFFVPGSRRAYLVFVLVLVLSNFLWGVRVITPLESALWYVVSLADGAILAIAYLTSVGARFARTATQLGAPADRLASASLRQDGG